MRERARRAGAAGWRFRGGWAVLAAAALLAAAAPRAMRAVVPAAAAGQDGQDGHGAGAQFALIVNGDDSFTHNYNVGLALTVLGQLGYAPQSTFVLAPPAAVPGAAAGAAPGAAPAAVAAAAPWHQPATGDGLRQALALLRTRLGPDDRLLVYLTGHGYRVFGRAMLGLADGSISARDLMQRLAALSWGKLILIADQCYSGAFVDAAVALGRNVVAVSSTDDRHEVRCEPWVRPLWLAAQAAAAGGGGLASVEAAFKVAADGVRRAGAGAAEGPRYGAAGTCAGHQNGFAAAPPAGAAVPAGQRGE
jgi:hypothetical protein